jgi:multiple sugar transport system substrate-binding protein
MRRILAAIVALALFGAAFAVAEGTSESAGAAKKVDMRVTWWGSQARHDRTVKVIEMYMKQHPNVTITYEFANWGDYWTKLTTMAAGGSLPDVMQQDYAYIGEWQTKNLLAPLDDYVKSGVLDFTNVAESSIAGGRIGGKLYAVNLGSNSQVFFLDLDDFQKAGMAVPAEQWTWPQFEQTALGLSAKLGKWGMGGGSGLWDEQIWGSIYMSNGQWRYTQDGKNLGYTDDSILVNHFKMILRLVHAKAFPSYDVDLANYVNKSVEAQAIVSGKSSIAYFHSNQIVAVWNAAGKGRNFQAIHLPRLPGGKPGNFIKPSQFFSVTTQAKAPEEGARFISFFTNDIEGNKILLAERGIPISSKVQEALKPLLDRAAKESFDIVAKVEKDASPIPPPDPKGHPDLVANLYLPQVVGPIMFEKITPEQGVALLRQKAPAILQK